MAGYEDDGGQPQGCGLTPGTIVGLVLVLLWMLYVIPAYENWRYPSPPPGQSQEQGPVEHGRAEEGAAGEGQAEEGQAAIDQDAPALDGGGLVPGQSAAEALADRAAGLPDPAPDVSGPAEPEPEVETVRVETDELIVEFTSLGASVESAYLRSYHARPEDTEPLRILMPLGGEGGAANSFILRPVPDVNGKMRGVDLSSVVWRLEKGSEGFDREGRRVVTFATARDGMEYRKTFVLHREGHVFDLEIEVVNAGRERASVELDLVGPNGIVPDDIAGGRKYVGMLAVLAARAGPGEPLNSQTVNYSKASGDDPTERSLSMAVNEWVAVKNRYFAAVCQAEDPALASVIRAEAVEPSVPLEGTVEFRNGSAVVLGTGSCFLEELRAGDLVKTNAVSAWYGVMTVRSDTEFTLATAYEGEDATVPASLWHREILLDQPNMAGVMRLSFGGIEGAASRAARFRSYLGPMQGDQLRTAGGEHGWEKLVDFGWFGWLSRLLLGLLRLFHGFTGLFGKTLGGYGLAILLLTLTVKGAMFPVMRKSMTSMHKMQKLGPEQKAIRKRYEKDKSPEAQRRMQAEIMELYRKHGVSPLGGCLPMLIQFPMFIALYGMLRTAFELRHEPYLWISDLTQSENLVEFGFTVPLIGWSALNLLPLAYLGLTLLQQHLQPKAADPQAAQQQKMMKFFMVFIFLLFYNMPSGLVLYFVFSNGFGILEQWIIRRRFSEENASVTADGGVALHGAATGSDVSQKPYRPTSWDKEDERAARKAEKRRKKKQQQRTGGPGMTR
jgi:YidC/Oxa1 family membrane protein insertase